MPLIVPFSGTFAGQIPLKPLLLHPHHDNLRIVIDPHGHNAVAEAAAQDELHTGVVGDALVGLREKLEFGGDQAAGAGDDDLAAVVVAGEDEVGAEALVELVILGFVGQKNDRLALIERAVSSVHTGRTISAKRSVPNTREHIIRIFYISVIQEHHAQSAHLSIKRIELIPSQSNLVVAANIINRGNLYRAFDEVERNRIRRVGGVDDVAGDDDDVGRGGLDRTQQLRLPGAKHLVMQIRYLHDS